VSLSRARTWILTWLIMAACCSAVGASSTELADHPVAIRIAGDEVFPPYEFVAESGAYTGFNVDLMNAISIELGISIELMPMPWSRVRAALENGEVDAIQGMKYSPDRDLIYDFSAPYLSSSMAIFVRKDRLDISSLEDLAGKKVAVQSGDISNEAIRRIQKVNSVVFDNQRAALESLLAGQVDAFLGNRLAGTYMVQRRMRTQDVKIAGEPIDPAPYCIAVREGDRELLDLMNRGLSLVRQSGLYDKIYSKWFGEQIEPPAAFLKSRMRALCYVIGAAAVVTLGVALWNGSLRREVAMRTRELMKINILHSTILENSFNAIVAANADLQIILANSSAVELLDVGFDQLIGHRWSDAPVMGIAGEDLVANCIRSAAVYRDRIVAVEVGGVERVMSFNLGPLNGSGAILVFRDVTDSKRLEEAEAIRDKMESLAGTVAGIAHEIRNPLTSIRTFVSMLPSKYDSPAFREEISKYVPAEIDRMSAIIADLMEYARPRKPIIQAFDIGELTDSIVNTYKFEAEQTGVVVKTDVAPNTWALADRNHVRQVLVNVVINAFESMDGPGQITITAAPDYEGRAVVTVTDSGHGIAKSDVRRVFEPFFTRKPSGTGLGLSVSYKLMRENGGDLLIESTEGLGTVVTLVLPQAGEGVDG